MESAAASSAIQYAAVYIDKCIGCRHEHGSLTGKALQLEVERCGCSSSLTQALGQVRARGGTHCNDNVTTS